MSDKASLPSLPIGRKEGNLQELRLSLKQLRSEGVAEMVSGAVTDRTVHAVHAQGKEALPEAASNS